MKVLGWEKKILLRVQALAKATEWLPYAFLKKNKI